MSINYLYILGLLSVLEPLVHSKHDIKNQKNGLTSKLRSDPEKMSEPYPFVKFSEAQKRDLLIVKPHRKKFHGHKPSKSSTNSHKTPKRPIKNNLKKINKRNKNVIDAYPSYSQNSKSIKKRPNSSGEFLNYDKAPSKTLKPSKRRPKKLEKKNRKSSKGSPIYFNSSETDKKLQQDSIKSPSIYLKPPKLGEKSQYNSRKLKKPFVGGKKKKLRKPSYNTDRLKGEENRQENYLNYVRDHEPIRQAQPEQLENTRDRNKHQEESKEEVNSSADDDNRVDFHIHGQDGPDSYVFGYDTGKGDNRQFRWEQRHENGTVTGQFGYYDPRGKFKKIFYKSDPFFGYSQNTVSEEEDARNLIETEIE